MDSSSFLQAPTQVTCAYCQRARSRPQRLPSYSSAFRRSEPPIIGRFRSSSTPREEVFSNFAPPDPKPNRCFRFRRSEPPIMRQFPHPSSASCEALGGPRLVVCRLGRSPPWRGAHYGSARPPWEGVCDVIFTLCAKCLMGQAFVAFSPAVGISRRAGGRGRSCACPPATRPRSRAAAAAARPRSPRRRPSPRAP